jgi:hypothetical protein
MSVIFVVSAREPDLYEESATVSTIDLDDSALASVARESDGPADLP